MLYERKSLNDVLNETPELLVRGEWLCLNIETSTSWPTKPQQMSFEGQTIWVMPHTTDNYPGLAINLPGNLRADDAWALLHRALSLLAWVQDSGAIVAFMSGGSIPRMMGLDRKTGISIRDEFDLSDLPHVPDERASLGLALMREARGLNHAAFAFLSFYRVLEVAMPNDGKERGRWIDANLANLERQAAEALEQLRQTVEGDIGEHLLKSGRHAIAHAKADPIINPDDPRDFRRLRAELPIMQGLAVLAIEQHLGVQSSHKIWTEHLYELRGWKSVFGEQLIAMAMANEEPLEGVEIELPLINVRLRKSAPFRPFERMCPLQTALIESRVEVVYRSEDGLVDLIFWLNFPEERLDFDMAQSIVARDDGSVQAAINARDLQRFVRDYLLNGELQMLNAESGELVSRKDAFLPTNCIVNIDACNELIASWDAVIAEREREAMPKAE